MISKMSRLGLMSAAAALCLWAAPGAQAADVNATVATCAGCHGQNGASTDASVPIIGGLSAPYLAEQLAAYKSKGRPCPPAEVKSGPNKGTKTDMCQVVKDLGDADIKAVADSFSKQKFVPAAQSADAGLAAKGKQLAQQNCEKCHSGGGTAADDDAGILAGQWMPYVKEQIAAFRSGSRKSDPKMKPVIDSMDAAGIDALVNFYGSRK